jgi:FixJ family two-component response regulator
MNSLQPVVFIVSDSGSVRNELRASLVIRGMSVTDLGSAKEYLTHGGRAAAACLIVDVALADMSGFELQQRVRGTDAPVVIVSASGQIWQSVTAMRLGAVDYLPLPAETDALLRAVHAAVEQDRIGRSQRQRFTSLTPREREVAGLVVRGLRSKHIAADLGISVVTVQIHRGKIMRKMRARSLPDLVRMADALGFTAPPPMAVQADGPQIALQAL